MSTDRKTSEAKKVEAARVSETSTSISHTNDKCITDFVMKGGSGMIIGTVFTVFFTRPRTYPIWFGMGIGMGLAYDCCQRRLANVDDNEQK